MDMRTLAKELRAIVVERTHADIDSVAHTPDHEVVAIVADGWAATRVGHPPTKTEITKAARESHSAEEFLDIVAALVHARISSN